MKLELNDSEINDALIGYVAGQGISIEGMDITVHLTAGRKANGNIATIDINKRGIPDTADVSDQGTGAEDSETTEEDLVSFGE